MLIDDPEVALNEVIVACQQSADHYEQACALISDNTTIQRLFSNLSTQRRQAANQLSDIIRNLGGLPREVDIEQEQLQMMWSHLKLAVSKPDKGTLLNEMISHETQLQTATSAAVKLELEQKVHRVLEQIQRNNETTLQRLRDISGED